MKKALFFVAAALVLMVPAANAQAQFCLDFDGFCDGLELSASGGAITGDWVSYDCAGSRDAMGGSLSGGTAQVLCGAGGCDTCVVSGAGVNWGFLIDGLDGTMDMFQDLASCTSFSPWIDELAYTATPGACTFLDNPGNLGSSRTKGWNS